MLILKHRPHEIILQRAKWMIKSLKIWCCSSPKVPLLFGIPLIYPLVSFTFDFLQLKQFNYVPDFRLFCQLQLLHATNQFQLPVSRIIKYILLIINIMVNHEFQTQQNKIFSCLDLLLHF